MGKIWAVKTQKMLKLSPWKDILDDKKKIPYFASKQPCYHNFGDQCSWNNWRWFCGQNLSKELSYIFTYKLFWWNLHLIPVLTVNMNFITPFFCNWPLTWAKFIKHIQINYKPARKGKKWAGKWANVEQFLKMCFICSNFAPYLQTMRFLFQASDK